MTDLGLYPGMSGQSYIKINNSRKTAKDFLFEIL